MKKKILLYFFITLFFFNFAKSQEILIVSKVDDEIIISGMSMGYAAEAPAPHLWALGALTQPLGAGAAQAPNRSPPARTRLVGPALVRGGPG